VFQDQKWQHIRVRKGIHSPTQATKQVILDITGLEEETISLWINPFFFL
jgi:hypothetical protein